MIKRFLIAFLVMLFSVSAIFAASFEQKNTITYFGTTDNNITVTWAEEVSSGIYDISLYHVEQETVVLNTQTTETQLTTTLPKSGHYVVRIRGCTDAEMLECGEWSESTDPEQAVVEEVANGWWVYGYVAPAGQITIE